jgi:hypothetical protein
MPFFKNAFGRQGDLFLTRVGGEFRLAGAS